MEETITKWLANGKKLRNFQMCLKTVHGKVLVKVNLEQHDGDFGFAFVEGCGVTFEEAWKNALDLTRNNSSFVDM